MRSFSWKGDKINSTKKNSQGRNNCLGRGKLLIVGIGPGDLNQLTKRAYEALSSCEVLVGYKTYIELLESLSGGKEIISTGMTQEVKRVQAAIDKARLGKTVCIVSSGDAGVYGMAGLVFELLQDGESLLVEVIPGVTSACSCAALLGAPLTHDCVFISLSDRLTDKDLILKRVRLAVEGDFVIVVYNPRSKIRKIPFDEACQILINNCSPETPIGIVRNAFRRNQEVEIISLKELESFTEKIDMFSTLIIGNSRTFVKDGRIVTPRGYL